MPDPDVLQLQVELEQVTCETACLLLQPGYDEEELWRLDACARELRQRLRGVVSRAAAAPRKRVAVVLGSGRMLSGG
jgi:hypothetical protein